jgi:hypothetical protein
MERVKAEGGSSGRISPASEASVGENKASGLQPVSPEQQQQQQGVDSQHHQDSADDRQVTRHCG